jgi:hypothetical protein
MQAKSIKYLVAFLAVIALIVPAFAKGINKSVTLDGETKIAGKILKPGDYEFRIDDNKLTIEVNRKVIVEVPGRWTPGDIKWDNDEFKTGADGQVQEIHFMGEKGVFIVGQ